jgi:DNA-binding NtrC family response regulator
LRNFTPWWRPLSHEQLLRWEAYAWPGNVRELRNAVVHLLTVGDLPRDEPVFAGPIPALSAPTTAPGAPEASVFAEVLAQRLPLPLARARVVEAFEQLYLERVLAEHGGNVVRAADASGIARRYFQILRTRRLR